MKYNEYNAASDSKIIVMDQEKAHGHVGTGAGVLAAIFGVTTLGAVAFLAAAQNKTAIVQSELGTADRIDRNRWDLRNRGSVTAINGRQGGNTQVI
jgi:hypothetical protein